MPCLVQGVKVDSLSEFMNNGELYVFIFGRNRPVL